MKLKRILEIVDDLHKSGIECYIIKETVHDMLLKKESDKVQLIIQFSLSKVENYFKSNKYKIQSVKNDMLVGYIENTRFEVRTLKYITKNEFFKQIICTDFTANTLIMRSDENLLDLFGAIDAIQNRQLIPVNDFNINTKEFDFAFYNDLINKIYLYNYRIPNNYVQDVFTYLDKFADKLKLDAKKNVINNVMNYCTEHDSRDSNILNFLNIKSFYKRITPERITQQGINELIQMPKEIMLMTLLYLYGFDKKDFPGVTVFNAICDFAGLDLSDEENYDKAYTEYGFEVTDEVITVQSIIAKLTDSPYEIPKHHHKSVFSELEKLKWRESPIMDDIGGFATATFSDIAKTIETSQSNNNFVDDLISYDNNINEEASAPSNDFRVKITNTIKRDTSLSDKPENRFTNDFLETASPPNKKSPNDSSQNNYETPIFYTPPQYDDLPTSNADKTPISMQSENKSFAYASYENEFNKTDPAFKKNKQPNNIGNGSLNLQDALSMFDESPQSSNQTAANTLKQSDNAVNTKNNDFSNNLRNKFNTIVLNKVSD